MRIQHYAKAVIDAINRNTKWNKIMNARQKIATLSLIALGVFGTVKAQTSNDNKLAFNGKAKTTKFTDNKDLTAPVVKKGASSAAAETASENGNLAIIIHHGKNDPISGERYAKGFAKGFESPQKTNNRPIYITAVHNDNAYDGPTFVEVFMNGQKWDYKDQYQFTPSDAGRLAPVIMDDFVKKYGSKKILPYRMSEPQQTVSMN